MEEVERKIICPNPLCRTENAVSFNETEIKQGGKNIKCSYCKFLLWISISKEKADFAIILVKPPTPTKKGDVNGKLERTLL